MKPPQRPTRQPEVAPISQQALAELKQICAGHLQRELTDLEALQIGQRIIRFLKNVEVLSRDVDQ